MAGDSKKADDTGKNLEADTDKKDSGTVVKKKQRGFFSRIWNRLFRYHEDDFEKRLQHISKEEVSLVARMKKRSQSLRRLIRNLIIFFVIFEVIAVVYAIMTTRSVDLDWKTRASRVLPMFLLPALSSLAYSGLLSFSRIFDRKDQKTLERLRAERQAKIDELKEKTNYYITQQLIQKYDTDPAAKAAAATVLASKLSADSGLKLHVGDESNIHEMAPTQSDGLRNRKQSHTKPASAGTIEQTNEQLVVENSEISDPNIYTKNNNQLVVGHYQPGSNTNTGGWIARFAALLVGEDPTQSYALICGFCHMHNGLVRKEDFPFITYYCPHCNALNKSQQLDGSPDSNIGSVSSSTNPKLNNLVSPDSGTSSEKVSPSSSPITALAETEGNKAVSLEDSKVVS